MIRFFIFWLLLLPVFIFSQNKKQKVVALSFVQLQDSMSINPKPVLLKIETDWCVYCKMQEAQILKNDSLQQLLSSNFYFVKMDAESKEDIKFNGRTYSFHAVNKVHYLAETLGTESGKLAYPVMIVLDNNYQVLYRNHGMVQSKDLYKILTLVKTGVTKKNK